MWGVYGQDQLLAQLESSLRQDRPAHAYMLVGPPQVGKMALAVNLAQSVNCLHGPGAPCGECIQFKRIKSGHHADVRVVSIDHGESQGPARTVIGIDDVKDVLRQVNLKPFEGAYSVVIFETAELMSQEAANALLKTLEEPPPQVMIMLLTMFGGDMVAATAATLICRIATLWFSVLIGVVALAVRTFHGSLLKEAKEQ